MHYEFHTPLLQNLQYFGDLSNDIIRYKQQRDSTVPREAE
jgi:hypothetical protein